MGQNPKKVSGGLIHDWMGAVFVPNLKLDDILKSECPRRPTKTR